MYLADIHFGDWVDLATPWWLREVTTSVVKSYGATLTQNAKPGIIQSDNLRLLLLLQHTNCIPQLTQPI